MAAAAPPAAPPDSSPAATVASSPPWPSPEELVARAVAPVKPAFLRPPPVRDAPKEESKANGGAGGAVVAEKKSKRQLKRERKQEQKSSSHLCIEVGKSGNVSSCNYGDSCRFSHDINAYLAQKPADLEGTCPYHSGPVVSIWANLSISGYT